MRTIIMWLQRRTFSSNNWAASEWPLTFVMAVTNLSFPWVGSTHVLSRVMISRQAGGLVAAMVVLFSVVSVCVWLLFVCQHDNAWTVRDITKFSGHHRMVERADKFENGYIGGAWAVADLTAVFVVVITRPPLAVARASRAACSPDGRQAWSIWACAGGESTSLMFYS